MMTLQRYFDFSPSILAYFEAVDQRFALSDSIQVIPVNLDFAGKKLFDIRAVIWIFTGRYVG